MHHQSSKSWMPGWMNKTVGKNTALWKSAQYSIRKSNSFVAAFCKKLCSVSFCTRCHVNLC